MDININVFFKIDVIY